MNKVKVTPEQAAALVGIKGKIGGIGVWKDLASVIAFKVENIGFSGARKFADELSDTDFVLALTVGYEVEIVLTPQQKLDELIQNLHSRRAAADLLAVEKYREYMLTGSGSYSEEVAKREWKSASALKKELSEILAEAGAK